MRGLIYGDDSLGEQSWVVSSSEVGNYDSGKVFSSPYMPLSMNWSAGFVGMSKCSYFSNIEPTLIIPMELM